MKAYINFLDIFIRITGTKDTINEIIFVDKKEDNDFSEDSEVNKAKIQLEEYLNNKRKIFDINLDFSSFTNFNKKIYLLMTNIEYGNTISYKELAKLAGNPKAYRAVGNANNKNKFVIVVPCHRVIGSDGSLTGFAPGLKYKEYLLKIEKGEV